MSASLMHYGVKGMKWRQTLKRKEEPANSAGRARSANVVKYNTRQADSNAAEKARAANVVKYKSRQAASKAKVQRAISSSKARKTKDFFKGTRVRVGQSAASSFLTGNSKKVIRYS